MTLFPWGRNPFCWRNKNRRSLTMRLQTQKPQRVCFLGAGRVAHLYHLPILRSMAGVEVAAIAEQDPELLERCRALVPAAALFGDYRELLESSPLDAAIICLPPALHAEAAIACFERQLPVYVEKPLATTLEDGRRVVDAWQNAGTAGWTGFNFRFHPLVSDLREAVRQNSIGEVVGVRAVFCSSGRALPDWKRWRSSGGGALLDLASHQVDLVRFILEQRVMEVNAITHSVASEDDTSAVQLNFNSSAMAEIFSSISSVEQHTIELTGTNGRLVFDRYRNSRLQFTPAKRDFSKAARIRKAIRTCTGLPHHLRDTLFPPREISYRRVLEAFMQTLRGEASPDASLIPDISAGYESLSLILMAEQSARAEKKFTVTGKSVT